MIILKWIWRHLTITFFVITMVVLTFAYVNNNPIDIAKYAGLSVVVVYFILNGIKKDLAKKHQDKEVV